jgi:hypothetical protein
VNTPKPSKPSSSVVAHPAPIGARLRAAECFLYIVVVAMADGIGREGVTVFARTINQIEDPALRIGVETFIAGIPLALFHIPLLRSVVRPTFFALVLLLFALAVGDGAAYRAAAVVDPHLSALAGGAVVGIAFASVLERQGILANVIAVVVGALGMLARMAVLTTFGSRDLWSYTAALVLLWLPLGILAFYGGRHTRQTSS